jgi:hypothetical protein
VKAIAATAPADSCVSSSSTAASALLVRINVGRHGADLRPCAAQEVLQWEVLIGAVELHADHMISQVERRERTDDPGRGRLAGLESGLVPSRSARAGFGPRVILRTG